MSFRLIDAIARFAAFVAGSFAAVLLLATVIDPDLFIHLEITPHRSVFFYLSVFGGILAIARGMIPEENRVFDSEVLMKAIVQYTHYLPDEWREQLHSKAVHTQFGELFAMKAVTFATELASVVLTPFILWFALPPCAPAIVDFFREFTVHVDGLGYVCSFAVFDFQRHGNVKVRFFHFFFTFSFPLTV
jgi:autophagy-related protein 9